MWMSRMIFVPPYNKYIYNTYNVFISCVMSQIKHPEIVYYTFKSHSQISLKLVKSKNLSAIKFINK